MADRARLVLIGRLEDLAGAGEIAVPPGPLDAVLATLDPALAVALCDERVRRALNGRLVAESEVLVLEGGDELAFLPPVSGG